MQTREDEERALDKPAECGEGARAAALATCRLEGEPLLQPNLPTQLLENTGTPIQVGEGVGAEGPAGCRVRFDFDEQRQPCGRPLRTARPPARPPARDSMRPTTPTTAASWKC